jgi:hypothetical protein
LPNHIKRELERAADRLQRGEALVSSNRPSLKPGTRLVRQWHGRVHHVLVLDEGYEYHGRRFTSLTQIASAITGTHWSGPSFFDLKRRKSVRSAVER